MAKPNFHGIPHSNGCKEVIRDRTAERDTKAQGELLAEVKIELVFTASHLCASSTVGEAFRGSKQRLKSRASRWLM